MEKSESSLNNILETIRREDPSPIFLGAVLSKDNSLLTNYNRFYALVKDMKDGNFPYPESMKPKIESINLHNAGYYYDSEEIERMFFGLIMGEKVEWYNIGPKRDRYQITDNAKYEFFEKWQDDNEALDFFKRCGDYLSLEEHKTSEDSIQI